MTYLFFVGGIISFLVSFFIKRYFIQFIVLGVFLFVLYLMNRNRREMEDIKKTIKEHNDLMKQDIDELKKSWH